MQFTKRSAIVAVAMSTYTVAMPITARDTCWGDVADTQSSCIDAANGDFVTIKNW